MIIIKILNLKINNKLYHMASKKQNLLNKFYNNDNILEIGVDEAGRGPMLGRVYSAAVILPKSDNFNHSLMKDSKKFTSEKKLNEAADYIKKNAIAWSVSYCTEQEIDKINILQATHKAMHGAISDITQNMQTNMQSNIQSNMQSNMQSNNFDIATFTNYKLLIDGNNFKPYTKYSDNTGFVQIPHVCIEGGDNKYTSIAAASILAKTTRDNYIHELCKNNEYLDDYYQISKNKGYGTQAHRDGIIKNGICEFHRKTFGICKNY